MCLLEIKKHYFHRVLYVQFINWPSILSFPFARNFACVC